MTLRHEDDQSFSERLAPLLATLETLRQSAYRSYIRRRNTAVPALAVTIASIGFGLVREQTAVMEYLAPMAVGLLVLGGLTWQVVMAPARRYKAAYKSAILPQIAAAVGLDSYDMSGGVGLEGFMAARILPVYTHDHSGDLFTGIYNGARISFCSLLLERQEQDKQNTRHIRVFKGLALYIVLPEKRFTGHTIILPERMRMMEWVTAAHTGLKPADMVDPVFEKQYSVFTNDQMEARYLVHPVMIDRMARLRDEFGAQSMSVGFRGHQVFILLPSKRDLFAPDPVHVPADESQGLLRLRREVEQILSLIDYLNLYRPA